MKNYLIKFWPIIFILFVWFIFASPYFLKNKVPFPSNYQVNNFAPWSADSRFAGPVKNNAMPDIITQIYPWKHLSIQMWKTGQIPLWNSYSFSGTPLLANYQSAVLSPFNLLFLLLPFVDAWSVIVLIQPLMAGIFMYAFVRSLGKSKVAGLISSVSFMFCGFITVWMGYATLSFAFLFLPFALFCVERYYSTLKPAYLLCLAISMPLSFFSGHFQISLYYLIFILIYILYKLFSTKKIANTVSLGLAVISGLLISMLQLLPSIEFYSQSLRSLAFGKNEVIPWGYISTFLAPDFLGNPVTRNDWFGHYAEWNAYVGVLPLMLAIYSIIGKKNTQTLFLSISALIVLFLAFPTPLQDLFVNLHIPVLSTSAASRIIVLYSFLVTVLSAIGFDQLTFDIRERKTKKIIIWLLSFAFLFLCLWIIVYFKLFIPGARIGIAKSNLILPSLIFVAISTTTLMAFVSKKILTVCLLLLLLIVSFDMLRFVMKWMPFDPKNLVFPDTTTTKSLRVIAGFNRVFGNLGGEANMYYNLPSIEGYDALYVKRYGEMVSFIEDGSIEGLNRSVVLFSKNGKHASKAINLLDVRYIAHKIADGRAVWTFPYWTYPEGQFRLIYKDNMYEFYENMRVFPHAFLTSQYEVEENEENILRIMFNNNFDLRREIVLEKDPKIAQVEGGVGNADILSYESGNMEISVNTREKALLFLSEIYYPGWKATIDGKDIPILRADYAFRAIPVEKGNHIVKFSYEPWSFRLGSYLAIGGLIGAIFLAWVSRNANRSIPSSS